MGEVPEAVARRRRRIRLGYITVMKPKSAYCERHLSSRPHHICMECKYNTNNGFEVCPNCGSKDVQRLSVYARVPRKNASERTWRIFFKKYAFSSGNCCGLSRKKKYKI